MPRNLTPAHLRCQWGACPSIHELDGGGLLIVGKSATMAAALERVSVGEDEHAVIVDRELVANVPPVWRTIGSAPRDGTRILLWWRHNAVPTIGWWNDGSDDCGEFPAGWISEADDFTPVNQHDCTHWLPLPLPPVEKVEA